MLRRFPDIPDLEKFFVPVGFDLGMFGQMEQPDTHGIGIGRQPEPAFHLVERQPLQLVQIDLRDLVLAATESATHQCTG